MATMIEVGSFLVGNTEYRELREKAKKYDEVKDLAVVGENHQIIHWDEIKQWREKAKKWDSICIDVNFKRDDNTGLTTEELIKEWKEKAKNWYDLIERFQFSPPDNIIYTITEWREKAKKWDDSSIKHIPILEYERMKLKLNDYEHNAEHDLNKVKRFDRISEIIFEDTLE